MKCFRNILCDDIFLEEIKLVYNHKNIVGKSDAINYVLYKVEQIAGSDTNVLILGETGTGKELAARAIHGTSPRKTAPKLRLVDELKKPHKDTTRAGKTLENVEREYIISVLEQVKWKVSGKNSAAEILGLDRSTLRARMRKLNIGKP